MRQLPNKKGNLSEVDIDIDQSIKGETFVNIMKQQGNSYSQLSANGCNIYLGNMETSETSYSTLNEGSDPGLQLNEWRPVLRPIKKMQDHYQVPFDMSGSAINYRRMIDGKHWIVASGIGINLQARLQLYPLHETCGTSIGGASSLSTTECDTFVLDFAVGDFDYREQWILVDTMTGSNGQSPDPKPITGYRGELTAKTTSSTGYLKYFNFEEAKTVNPSTYQDHLQFYGDEVIQPMVNGSSLMSWRSDGAPNGFVQTVAGRYPILVAGPVTFSSANFNGGSNYSMISTNTHGVLSGDGFYFATALKPYDAGAGTNRYILYQNGTTGYNTAIFLDTDNKLRFVTRHGAGYDSYVSTLSIATDVWTDVACVIYPSPKRDGYMIKEIWIDGALHLQKQILPTLTSGVGPTTLGNASSLSINFKGEMAIPVWIDVKGAPSAGGLSGSFNHRDINGLNLSWRRTFTGIGA